MRNACRKVSSNVPRKLYIPENVKKKLLFYHSLKIKPTSKLNDVEDIEVERHMYCKLKLNLYY